MLSKNQYDELVIAKRDKSNKIVIWCFIIIIVLIIIASIFFLINVKEISHIFPILYLLIFNIFLLMFFITYLYHPDCNYCVFCICNILLFPIFPIYLILDVVNNKFSINVSELVSLFLIAFVSSITTPVLCILLNNQLSKILPTFIIVILIVAIMAIFKYAILNLLYKKIFATIKPKNTYLLLCSLLVVEYIFYIVIFQIVVKDYLGNTLYIVVYYIEKIFLIYTLIWLIYSITNMMNKNN